MAALQHAARKLLLKRTQRPVVSRRLVASFIHTSSPPASSCPRFTKRLHSASSPACRAPISDEEAKILRFQNELQSKKQEMYDLLSEVEENKYYMPNGRDIIDWIRNVKLLQNLSVEIHPKPSDTRWDFYWKGRKFNVWGVYVASAVVTLWIANVSDRKQDEDPEGEKIDLAETGERVTENHGVAG